VPGDPVQYPIVNNLPFEIDRPTRRELGTPDGGTIEGGRTALMRFSAQDIESGITSLEGELVFDFVCTGHRTRWTATGPRSMDMLD